MENGRKKKMALIRLKMCKCIGNRVRELEY